jgi:hypothetical protein
MACAQVEDAVLIASDRRVILLDGHTLARLPQKGRGESEGYAGFLAADHPVGWSAGLHTHTSWWQSTLLDGWLLVVDGDYILRTGGSDKLQAVTDLLF